MKMMVSGITDSQKWCDDTNIHNQMLDDQEKHCRGASLTIHSDTHFLERAQSLNGECRQSTYLRSIFRFISFEHSPMNIFLIVIHIHGLGYKDIYQIPSRDHITNQGLQNINIYVSFIISNITHNNVTDILATWSLGLHDSK